MGPRKAAGPGDARGRLPAALRSIQRQRAAAPLPSHPRAEVVEVGPLKSG